MPQALGSEAYTGHLKRLLPRGRAWEGEELEALLSAFAASFAEMDGVLSRLLDDILPASTSDLLTDWERVTGLPDDCSEPGAGIGQRRGAVLDQLVTQAGNNSADYVAIAAKLGATITIAEHDRTRARAIAGLDTTNGKWRFVWWITVQNDSTREFSVESDVNMPIIIFDRNPELECRLQKAKPAHTHLVIGYS